MLTVYNAHSQPGSGALAITHKRRAVWGDFHGCRFQVSALYRVCWGVCDVQDFAAAHRLALIHIAPCAAPAPLPKGFGVCDVHNMAATHCLTSEHSTCDLFTPNFLQALPQASQPLWRPLPQTGFGVCDVRDLAAAHCLALFHPSAKGRYLCMNQSGTLDEIVRELAELYPGHICQPRFTPPKWMVWLLGPYTGMPRDMVT